MKKTRLFILLVISLLGLFLVSGTVMAVKATQNQISSIQESTNNSSIDQIPFELGQTTFINNGQIFAPPPLYELGDAPDSTNHLGESMTAYTPGGLPPGTQGKYPTVFDPGTGIPPGPRHSGFDAGEVHLGPGASFELDADMPPDNDGVTNLDPKANIPDLDAFDDGVIHPIALPHCVTTAFSYTVNVPATSSYDDFFVNVWFDWDRDGDWADVPQCPGEVDAPDWAVQDQAISLSPGMHVLSTPTFLSYNPSGGPIWMRITISEQEAPRNTSNRADGRGPMNGYAVGETEDYYLFGGEQQKEFDIYIKDNPTDDGSVPSSDPWWVSPDIWIRNDGDCTNGVHQNADTDVDTTVCVRVRNRSSSPVTNIKINLYYSIATSGLTWPASWLGIGSANIPILAPMSSAVRAIPWHTPNLPGHFCLLARVDSLEDPIDSGFDTVIPTDKVKNNNNIAQRNLHVIDFPEIRHCDEMTSTIYVDTAHFYVINPINNSVTVDFKFKSVDFPLGDGELIVNPATLWGRWNSLINFNQVDTKLKLTGFPAEMKGIQLTPYEFAAIYIDISAPGNIAFEISITESEKNKLRGGNNYVRRLPACIYVPIALYE